MTTSVIFNRQGHISISPLECIDSKYVQGGSPMGTGTQKRNSKNCGTKQNLNAENHEEANTIEASFLLE